MRFVPVNLLLYFFLITLGASGFFFAAIWPQTEGFYAFIVFAAIGGLCVALYIYSTRKKHAQLVCPVGSDCNAVVNSRYAKFFGIHLEYWGMLYYSIILISYLTLIFAKSIFPEVLLSGLVLLSSAAFLFSLYLLFVQAFLLRQWCIWCLLSASLSIVIFIVSLVSIDFAVEFLVVAGTFIIFIQSLGFVLGMGGVTAVFLLFSKFLKDSKIDGNELKVLMVISELIWLGLALVLVSQLTMYVAGAEFLARSGPFLMQTLALFISAIGGAMLMIIFAPVLEMIPFGESVNKQRPSPLKSLRRPLFLTGAITLSSWYFAFILNYISTYSLVSIFIAYIVVLIVTVIITLLFCERANKTQSNFTVAE